MRVKIVGDIMKNRPMSVKTSRIIFLCVTFLFLSNMLMITSTHNYAKAEEDATSNVPPSYMNPTPAHVSLDMPLFLLGPFLLLIFVFLHEK